MLPSHQKELEESIKGFITLGDSRCLSTFPLQVHAIFCMQPVQMTDVLPRDWSLLSWKLEQRHCTQAQIWNIIPRRRVRGILDRTPMTNVDRFFWVDLCIYVCFCTCICYVTVFLKLKPACKCVSSWQSGSRPMIDRLCLSLTASLLISQSEMVFRSLFKSHLHPFLFSIHFDFNLIQILLSTASALVVITV